MAPKPEEKLAAEIRQHLNTGKVAKAHLSTDERVLARITDGIYRQPASALRELIANAYDADATEVHIQTDAPRFEKITIRDNGNGLSIEAMTRLINHIGGSPKRTAEGVELGISNAVDQHLSPKGRRLIGKIGIGLFSVAQLTRHFYIISKTKGTDYRLMAEVFLKNYTEDEIAQIEAQGKTGRNRAIDTGEVRIISKPANDKNAHGTEIILEDLRPQTQQLLQSAELWKNIRISGGSEEERQSPKYHIGRLKPGTDILELEESLPWGKTDPPESRFRKFYQKILDAVVSDSSDPRLEMLLDNYLRTLWTLSLAAPLDYIDVHPFALTSKDEPIAYLLNPLQGRAEKIELKKGESLRQKLDLHAPERGTANIPFKVVIDDIELRRPLRFSDLPKGGKGLQTPLIFVGTAEPDLSAIAHDERGGDLSFEAYFLWNPKIVPKEHIGVLVRIGDASGTLFDESFMKYQISELTRLRQITAEIFVRKGLDVALNIDRESFNYAHPHYQYLMKWVHRALRQVATTQKWLNDQNKEKVTETIAEAKVQSLHNTVAEQLGSKEEETPDAIFVDGGDPAQKELFSKERKQGKLVFDTSAVFGELDSPKPDSKGKKPPKKKTKPKKKTPERIYFEEQIKAVARILEAYGCFEGMSYAKQQRLLRAIVAVFREDKV